jgi:hypothetical protein
MPAEKRWLLLLLTGFVLAAGTVRATGALSASPPPPVVRSAAQVRLDAVAVHASARLIRRYRARAWRWQTLMGVRRTRRAISPYTPHVLRFWRRTARRARVKTLHPPHRRAWLCIHRSEGSWWDAGDPYWGGLQMDRGFMDGYAPHYLLRRGLANSWSAIEQMWVAERAFRSGRGFYAWPNTARACGLI